MNLVKAKYGEPCPNCGGVLAKMWHKLYGKFLRCPDCHIQIFESGFREVKNG